MNVEYHVAKLWLLHDLSSLCFQSLLYEIITGVHSAGTDAASSSSARPIISTTKSVDELLSDIAPAATVWIFFSSWFILASMVNLCWKFVWLLIMQDSVLDEISAFSGHESSQVQVILFTITIHEIQMLVDFFLLGSGVTTENVVSSWDNTWFSDFIRGRWCWIFQYTWA